MVYNDQHPDVLKITFRKNYRYREDYKDYFYNIEVKEHHTYFVGDIGIWVLAVF